MWSFIVIIETAYCGHLLLSSRQLIVGIYCYHRDNLLWSFIVIIETTYCGHLLLSLRQLIVIIYCYHRDNLLWSFIVIIETAYCGHLLLSSRQLIVVIYCYHRDSLLWSCKYIVYYHVSCFCSVCLSYVTNSELSNVIHTYIAVTLTLHNSLQRLVGLFNALKILGWFETPTIWTLKRKIHVNIRELVLIYEMRANISIIIYSKLTTML